MNKILIFHTNVKFKNFKASLKKFKPQTLKTSRAIIARHTKNTTRKDTMIHAMYSEIECFRMIKRWIDIFHGSKVSFLISSLSSISMNQQHRVRVITFDFFNKNSFTIFHCFFFYSQSIERVQRIEDEDDVWWVWNMGKE